MLLLDEEWLYISSYVFEKEKKYTEQVRKALDLMHHLITKENKNFGLAAYIADKTYKDPYGVSSKDFYKKVYAERSAHIKNAKEEFKKLKGINIDNILKEYKDHIEVKNICACGCGKEVKKGNKFINGHNPRFKSEEEKQIYLENIRNARKNKKDKNVIYLKDKGRQVL